MKFECIRMGYLAIAFLGACSASVEAPPSAEQSRTDESSVKGVGDSDGSTGPTGSRVVTKPNSPPDAYGPPGGTPGIGTQSRPIGYQGIGTQSGPGGGKEEGPKAPPGDGSASAVKLRLRIGSTVVTTDGTDATLDIPGGTEFEVVAEAEGAQGLRNLIIQYGDTYSCESTSPVQKWGAGGTALFPGQEGAPSTRLETKTRAQTQIRLGSPCASKGPHGEAGVYTSVTQDFTATVTDSTGRNWVTRSLHVRTK